MKDIPFAYTMSLDTLEEFFTRCVKEGVGDLKTSKFTEAEFIQKRCEIMDALVKELRAIKLTENDTKRALKSKKIIGFKKGD